MEMSKLFYTIQKEVPADAEIPSHQLLLKGCFIRKIASGIYSYLPLGLTALKNIEQIIRDEMNIYAGEILMPALLPADLYKQTGRWEKYGETLFRLVDRNKRDFCLGPTHEEFFTTLIMSEIKTYKKLPIILYQIQNKYRDEQRPRYGMVRCRDFMMKDAYSFDKDYEGLDVSYENMRNAYNNIFKKCSLDHIIVDADSGAIGGSNSQEFMVKSEYGEDSIIYCTSCSYASNIEKAECINEDIPYKEDEMSLEEIYTPNVRTIEELNNYIGEFKDKFVKQIIYKADDNYVAVLVKGNREINETKLVNLIGCDSVELADFNTVKSLTNAEVGFGGPIGLKIPIYIDNEVLLMKNLVVGANKTDYHLKNVNINRDFKYSVSGDLRNIEIGDKCPACLNNINITKGIEIGHIFKLGTVYSEKLDCTYLDDKGIKKDMVMGCYGIGVSRLLSAIIEQHHDDRGIIWPTSIAPFKVSIIPIFIDNTLQKEKSYEIYNTLKSMKIDVLIDDRDERPGVKFKDADLIGIPFKIIVGRDIEDGFVEIKDRKTDNTIKEKVENVCSLIQEMLSK